MHIAQSNVGGFNHNLRVEDCLISFIILWWRVGWFHSQSYCGGFAGFIHNPTVEGWLVSCTILWWRVGCFHAQSYGGGLAGFIHNPTVEGCLGSCIILLWRVGWFHAQSSGGGFIHNQGIRIKGKEMALVWHEKASRTALQTSTVIFTHTLLVHNLTTVKEIAEQCCQLKLNLNNE